MSEATLACETVEIFGTKHTEVDITASAAKEMAFSWLKSMDQPSIDGLNTYIISKAARNQGLVVALSGLGGDELFGGYYNSFSRVPRIEKILKRYSWIPRWMWSLIAKLAGIGRDEAVIQKAKDLLKSDPNLLDLYLHFRRNVSNKYLVALGVNTESFNLSSSLISLDIKRYQYF
jgi:asparagine synthase (glutamine-hydrolysing)